MLFKAFSAKLQEKAPDVYAFLRKFTITTDDQLEMLPPMEIDGKDPAAVAADWVAAQSRLPSDSECLGRRLDGSLSARPEGTHLANRL